MGIIATQADIAEGLVCLARRDGRLRAVIEVAGNVPLRREPAGFAGLARIVVAQQVSIASATAIWQRLAAALAEVEATRLLGVSDEDLRAVGLSASKVRTLRAIAAACRDGFDLAALSTLPVDEAHRRLTTIRGIGPWTADVYLLFCLGHADIFPAGDLALRHAVADAFGLAGPLPTGNLVELAAQWSPWRGVAARLFWSYYRVTRNKAAVPV